MSKQGYSREGFFGEISHYDGKGRKIGESRPGLFGGYTNYDARGHKVGRSEENIFGGGYTHYGSSGRKTGTSSENYFSGGYTNRDASGHVTGRSDRSLLDLKEEEEIRRTGSLYGTPSSCPADTRPSPQGSCKSGGSTGLSKGETTLLTILVAGVGLVVSAGTDIPWWGEILLWLGLIIVAAWIAAAIENSRSSAGSCSASVCRPAAAYEDEEPPQMETDAAETDPRLCKGRGIYRYVIVRFPGSEENSFYLAPDGIIHVGDVVVLPHADGVASVEVLGVVECAEAGLPLPLERMQVIQKRE